MPNWRKVLGYVIEYGGKALPGPLSKVTDAVGDDLEKASDKPKPALAECAVPGGLCLRPSDPCIGVCRHAKSDPAR